MRRHEQLHLIDDTPLGLWDGPRGEGKDKPAMAAMDPDGADAATRAILSVSCGGLATVRCLGCSKPPRAGSHFCSSKCKAKWQAGMNTWNRSLDKSPIDPSNANANLEGM